MPSEIEKYDQLSDEGKGGLKISSHNEEESDTDIEMVENNDYELSNGESRNSVDITMKRAKP